MYFKQIDLLLREEELITGGGTFIILTLFLINFV